MKDGIAGVLLKKNVGLKPKMYSFQVGDNSEHKSVKCVNKIVDKKYLRVNAKNIFLNKSCLRHLMNRIQSKSFFFLL